MKSATESCAKPVELWVVMPVFNENAAITAVVQEWTHVLRQTKTSFVLMAIDDGSTDSTGAALDGLSASTPELRVVHRHNEGHGRACLFGYDTAIERGASWVFQIDSDGQCDSRFFPEFWRLRTNHPLVWGYRSKRDDGWGRTIVSRALSVGVLLTTRLWVRDANVPYRLVRSDLLREALANMPKGAHFSNVLLSCLLAKRHRIEWVPIRFGRRSGGRSVLRVGTAAGLARQALADLTSLKFNSGQPSQGEV